MGDFCPQRLRHGTNVDANPGLAALHTELGKQVGIISYSLKPAGKTNCCLHCGQRTLWPTCLGPKRNRRLHWGQLQWRIGSSSGGRERKYKKTPTPRATTTAKRIQ